MTIDLIVAELRILRRSDKFLADADLSTGIVLVTDADIFRMKQKGLRDFMETVRYRHTDTGIEFRAN